MQLPKHYPLITFEKSYYVIEFIGKIARLLCRLPKLPFPGGHLKN